MTLPPSPRGRPPKAPEERRDRRVVTFLRGEEFLRLCDYADRRALSLSAACHHLLEQALAGEHDEPPKLQIHKES